MDIIPLPGDDKSAQPTADERNEISLKSRASSFFLSFFQLPMNEEAHTSWGHVFFLRRRRRRVHNPVFVSIIFSKTELMGGNLIASFSTVKQ